MFYALPPGCECGTARVPAPKCSRLPIQLRIRAPGVPGEMRVARPISRLPKGKSLIPDAIEAAQRRLCASKLR